LLSRYFELGNKTSGFIHAKRFLSYMLFLEPEGFFSVEFLITNSYHEKVRNPIPGTMCI